MNSQSDWEVTKNSTDRLEALGVTFKSKMISTHRAPERLDKYVRGARDRGLKVIIAGGGMAAALPGSAATITPLPVFGVPLEGKTMGGAGRHIGHDKTPCGSPVGTLGLGKAGAVNSAMFAYAIVVLST